MGWQRTIALIGMMLVAAVMWDLPVLDRIIVALVVLFIICWYWNKTALAGLGIERTVLMDRVNVGDTMVEEITVTNFSRLPKLWVELSDHSTLPGHNAHSVVSLRGRGRSSWNVQTAAERRGRYRLGPILASAGDPVGMFTSDVTLPVSHEILVFPARIDVSGISLPTAQLSGGRVAPRNTLMTTASVSSVRDYAPGDPMNRIAWSATARRGQLMVKEFEPDPTADLWILLDLNDDGQFDLQQRQDLPPEYRHLNTTVEYIISIGASLANVALAQGRRVGVILNREEPIRLEPDNSERQSFRIAETLAVVTSSGSRSLTESLAADARKFSRTSGLVVITADPRSDWVAAGAALVERLVPVTAVIVDAGGDGPDDIDPLMTRLARARVNVHRYPTITGMIKREKQ